LINAGATENYLDTSGRTWLADTFYNTGAVPPKFGQVISSTGTYDQELYRSERYDKVEFPNLIYEIPLPEGLFELKIHFAETYSNAQAIGARVFDIYVEDSLSIDKFDIYKDVGGNAGAVKTVNANVKDGSLTIEFKHVKGNPKLNAIEINSLGTVKPHYAHAVPGGPYFATDTKNVGSATVDVDGTLSHTHLEGSYLESWKWRVNGNLVGSGEVANFTVNVGTWPLSLEVKDVQGDVSLIATTVTVRPFGFPYIEDLSPDRGRMEGGDTVTIIGSGFTAVANVNFGSLTLSGSAFVVDNEYTIRVLSVPKSANWGVVPVTVKTSTGTSDPFPYEYLPMVPLIFQKGDILTNIAGPTVITWGPDGRMYVGTQGGEIIRFELKNIKSLHKNHPMPSRDLIRPRSEASWVLRSILWILKSIRRSMFPIVSSSTETL
jgi:hypothetical protein